MNGSVSVKFSYSVNSYFANIFATMQVETLKATSAGKAVSYKIAYGLPTHVMKEWGLYVSTPRCGINTLFSIIMFQKSLVKRIALQQVFAIFYSL